MLLGKHSIQIKDFSCVNKTKSVRALTLSLSSNDAAKSLYENIIKSKRNLKLKLAEFPFFSEFQNLRTRVLIATSLGCGIFPGACKNFGPPTLNKFLKNSNHENEDMNEIIGNHAANKLNETPDVA